MNKRKLIWILLSASVLGMVLTGCNSSKTMSPGQNTQAVSPSQNPSNAGTSDSTEPKPPDSLSSWLPNHRTQSISKNHQDVVFIDSQHGWKLVPGQGVMMGEPADIYATADGGQTWQKITEANQQNADSESANLPDGTLPYSGQKNGISFASSATGWVTGYVPRAGYQWIYVTYDGGKSWVHQELPVPKDISGYTSMTFDLVPPVFFNSQDGLLVERIADVPGNISSYPTYVFFYSEDGGKTWLTAPPSAITLAFPDSDPNKSGKTFSATVSGTTWQTTDGGYTWESK